MVVRLPIGVLAGEKRCQGRTEQWRSGEIVETGNAKAGAIENFMDPGQQRS